MSGEGYPIRLMATSLDLSVIVVSKCWLPPLSRLGESATPAAHACAHPPTYLLKGTHEIRCWFLLKKVALQLGAWNGLGSVEGVRHSCWNKTILT